MDTLKSSAYEDILNKIGSFGKFQKFSVFMLTWVNVTIAFNTIGYVFWAARPDHWCDVTKPEHFSNVSQDTWKRTMIPYDDEKETFSTCEYYAYENISHIALEMDSESMTSYFRNVSEREKKKCKNWQYDTSQYQNTIVMRFNLVCDDFWWRSISQSAYMAGYGIGLLLIGPISDRFGRRTALLLCAPFDILISIAVCFSTSIYMFVSLRCLQALCCIGLYMATYTLLIEIVGQEWRVFVAQIHMANCAVAYSVVPLVAYFIRDGFYLQLVLVAPTLIFASYFCVISESPRWLLSKGKTEEFCELIRKIARVNGKADMVEDVLSEYKILDKGLQNKSEEISESCSSIFTNPLTLVMTLVQFLIWFTASMIYFGLSLSATSLSGNDFVNTFISVIVEVPAHLIVIPANKRVGRKPWVFSLLAVCALTLGSTAFMNKDWTGLIITATTVGKFCVSALFSSIYLYASELYPTTLRGKGISFCSVSARVGSLAAPFTAELAELYPGLPQILFSILCCGAALGTLLLPETRGKPLPQTSNEVKDISKHLCWVKNCIADKPKTREEKFTLVPDTRL